MSVGEESSITSIILVYYVVATLLAYIRRPAESSDSQSSHERKAKKSTSPRFRKTVLAATTFTMIASILESVFQGMQVGGLSKVVNDRLFADLSFLMTWIILLLGLLQLNCNGGYPHIGAWTLSFLVRAVYIPQSRSLSLSQPPARALATSIAVQVLGILFTIATALLQKCFRPPPKRDEGPESQPLLSEEDQSDSTKTGKDHTSGDDEDDAENEDARKGIHDRPFRQYMMSFKIFAPFMWPVTTRQKFYLAGMFLCSIAARIINILQPLSLGAVVNGLSYASVPWRQIFVYILLNILSSSIGIPLLETVLDLHLSNEQALALNRAAYDHIMGLSADFQDSKSSASVWQSIYRARSVVTLFHDIAFQVSPALIDLFAGFLVLGSVFGGYMGLLLTTTIISFLWMTVRVLGPRTELQRVHREAYIAEFFQLVQSTSNWYTCTHHGQVPREKEQFWTKGQATQDAMLSMAHFSYSTRTVRYFVHMVAFFGACSLAAIEIARKEQMVGAFVVLTSYWAQLSGPLGQIVENINRTFEKLVDAERLLVLLERKVAIQDAPNAKQYSYQGGAVQFENVHFSYDGKRHAADDVTFRSTAGTKTALVGQTGAGKSSLMKLLFRFYDPEQGRILLDGQDLKDVTLESFRKHIGVVPQDPALFDTTVLDNVRYPDFSIGEEAVKDACKAVSLHDKIMTFEKGYMTKVGERGCRLSGGELQRLAIARAILRKPDILLLDEATSSVDSVTEAKIQESLDILCEGKTTFVIAHRLSTILKADQILVIDEGRLEECGNHDELLAKKGAYYKLWTTQLKLQSESEKYDENGGTKEDLLLVNDLKKTEAESTDLIRVTSGGDALHKSAERKLTEEGRAEQPARGRETVKARVNDINRRLSSSRSPQRGAKDQPTQQSNVSPTRSRLKGNAPAFVPRNYGTAQQDGIGEQESAQVQTNGRRTSSEPAAEGGRRDPEGSPSTENENDEEKDSSRFSRIPKRNR